MKRARHKMILELIEKMPIDRQEELMNQLRAHGFDVTQATVSRDIRELRLVKASTGDGNYRYVASSAGQRVHTPNRFETIFRESAPDAVPFIRPSDAVTTSGRESSLLRGLALHDIFAGLSLDRAVEKYGISFQDAETFASMRDEFLASSLCSGCIAEYKELPLWFASHGSWVRGRVDRILVHADRVIVVDFKSGHRDSCGDLMEGYCNEVRTYKDVVSQIFCKKTKGYLYFPEDEEKLFPVFPGENL